MKRKPTHALYCRQSQSINSEGTEAQMEKVEAAHRKKHRWCCVVVKLAPFREYLK